MRIFDGGSRTGVIVLTAAVALGAAARPGWAQEEDAQGAFGSGDQVLIVQAEQFTGRTLAAGDLVWAPVFTGYYSSSGSGTPIRYFAPLQLPAGAVVTGFQCLVRDQVANDIALFLWETSHDVSSQTPIAISFANATSTGSTGYQQPSAAVTPPKTIRYSTGNLRFVYHVSADLSTTTFLRECRITWHRSVSPPPATATFSDVPTSHPMFRFVEALVAAGITGGCAPGLYCPNNALSRAEMAVFIAVALGLHWPQ